MAKIIVPKEIPPTVINKFLGVNENVDGEYGLKLGEASKQVGFRVTSGMQLKRMEGYKTIMGGFTGNVQGMWYGKLNNENMLLVVNNGKIYQFEEGEL